MLGGGVRMGKSDRAEKITEESYSYDDEKACVMIETYIFIDADPTCVVCYRYISAKSYPACVLCV